MPQIAEAVASPLAGVDKITMYGDGNSTKLVQEMMVNTNQVLEGIKGSTGLDIAQLLAGYFTGKASGKAQNLEGAVKSIVGQMQGTAESDDDDDFDDNE